MKAPVAVWLVARHLLRYNVHRGRLSLVALVCLGTFALVGLLGSQELARDQAEFRQLSRRANATRSLEHVLVPLPFNRLPFVADGSEKGHPSHYIVLPDFVDQPVEDMALRSSAQASGDLDWSFAVGTLLSLLALFVSHDFFSAEREEGRLKLLLSYPVTRLQLLAGGFLGSLLSLAPWILAGLVTSAWIVSWTGPIVFTVQDWGRMTLAAGLSLILVVQAVLLGLCISAFSRDATRSLMLSLSAWIVLVVLLPGGAEILAKRVAPAPTFLDLERQIGTARREFFGSQRPLDSRRLAEVCAEPARDPRERRLGLARLQEELLAQHGARLREYTRQVGRVRGEFLRRNRQQFDLARRLGRLSPIGEYRQAMESAVGRDPVAERRSFREVTSYMTSYSRARARLVAGLEPTIYGPRVSAAGCELQGMVDRSFAEVDFETSALPRFSPNVNPAGESALSGHLARMLLVTGLLLLFAWLGSVYRLAPS